MQNPYTWINGHWKEQVLTLLAFIMLGSVTCGKHNPVVNYAAQYNTSQTVIERLEPLGYGWEMLQSDSIVEDRKVVDTEIEKFQDLDQYRVKNTEDSKPLNKPTYVEFVKETPKYWWQVRLLTMEEAEKLEYVYPTPDNDIDNLSGGDVDYLSEDMKRDALSCIILGDKPKTFENLVNLIRSHLAVEMEYKYPSYKEYDYPRDTAVEIYNRQCEVDPNCDDFAMVYDVMADYVIEHEGWDEQDEALDSNGVECDVFSFLYTGFGYVNIPHAACIVNINGEEWVADPALGIEYLADPNGTFLPLKRTNEYVQEYKFNKEECPTLFLLMKYNRKYKQSVEDRKFISEWLDSRYYFRIGFDENSRDKVWYLMRNQSPESERKLQELYLMNESLRDTDFKGIWTIEDGKFKLEILYI